jgi:transposase, IS30 family
MANKDHRGRIINNFSIEQRLAIVAQKSRIGDWEGDTIIVKGYQVWSLLI